MAFGSEGEAACRSCQDIYEASDLDRYLFCPPCRTEVNRRGARWGRLVGFATSLGVAAFVVLSVQPSGRYVILYALVLALTYSLMSRIALAVVQGYYRSRGSVETTT